MRGLPYLALVAAIIQITLPETKAQSALPSPFEQRVQVEAVRAKRSKIEGGDFDDKKDRVSFTLKFVNTDTKADFPDCKGEFFVLAQSIVDRKALQVLGVEKFALSLPPRGTSNVTTGEVVSQWDNTGARFGAKYDGWVLIVRDSGGKIVMKKATNPTWLPLAEKLGAVQVKTFFDKALKPVEVQ